MTGLKRNGMAPGTGSDSENDDDLPSPRSDISGSSATMSHVSFSDETSMMVEEEHSPSPSNPQEALHASKKRRNAITETTIEATHHEPDTETRAMPNGISGRRNAIALSTTDRTYHYGLSPLFSTQAPTVIRATPEPLPLPSPKPKPT